MYVCMHVLLYVHMYVLSMYVTYVRAYVRAYVLYVLYVCMYSVCMYTYVCIENEKYSHPFKRSRGWPRLSETETKWFVLTRTDPNPNHKSNPSPNQANPNHDPNPNPPKLDG